MAETSAPVSYRVVAEPGFKVPGGKTIKAAHYPVSHHWRLKSALSAAAEVAFEGTGDAQVHWRTGRHRGRTYTLKGMTA